MTNPIFSTFQPRQAMSQNYNNNSLMGMMNQIRQSPNPQQAMQNMVMNSPDFRNIVNYINQNGGDARSAFYNLAAQKGINPESILQRLR